ncbi:MAG: ATP-binding cassette domain-containing protein [Roseomonas sp.]|nr:ATP-binding cassette domain-containing protein [Roseomonas sp.]
MVRIGRVALAYPTPGGDPGQEALRDVSFALGEGSFTWLLGPSGAGKSSILRLMHAAIRPSSGVVSVLGTDIGQAERARPGGLCCSGPLAPHHSRPGANFPSQSVCQQQTRSLIHACRTRCS